MEELYCPDCKFFILCGRQREFKPYIDENNNFVEVQTTNWYIIGECDRKNRGLGCKRKLAKPEKTQQNLEEIDNLLNMEE